MKKFNITLITALALFAMFFGTGNIIFPMKLGLELGDQFLFGMSGFLLSGVGLPLLGIYAVSLCDGSYQDFFGYFAKRLGNIMIAFIIVTVCLLVATPRTAIVTYSTFEHYLPRPISTPYFFNIAYFSIVYFLTKKDDTLVEIIGRYISPVKITCIITLVIIACLMNGLHSNQQVDPQNLFNKGFTMGYGTMDLLAAFFLCTTTYNNIKRQLDSSLPSLNDYCRKVMMRGSLLGGLLTVIVYIGLMYSTFNHSGVLHNTPTESLIFALSMVAFGSYGSLFLCFLVLLASIATASVLCEVVTHYGYQYVVHQKISKKNCLRIVLLIVYGMSILGFEMVMKIAVPILNILYPILILYCFCIIYVKKFHRGESFISHPSKFQRSAA